MSAQSRSGGGGGMHSSGHEAPLPPDGGGGGGGGAGPARKHAKPRIGWSSIAFGATPVCPWKSQKATPTTRALAQSLTRLRATRICLFRTAVAVPLQNGAFGASVII